VAPPLLEEQMLRKEQNEFITRTGPSTPMGQLFRCYWTPALLTEELPQNDCPPVRVKLLSERLVAFRDSQGRYGLIDEFCAHRGASLWFGRNEECGLRCPYHGWKFDLTGQCVEVPSEPVASGFVQRIKLKAGEHGTDRRPHEGKPGVNGQRHHHGPPLPVGCGQGGGGKGRRPARD
jgi:nitrite reductase/ring-hydroxylating ferredoxin subunit